ncbi:MAG: hypothetical protein U0T83_06340 [Bacteriovoracaceae bacterium]
MLIFFISCGIGFFASALVSLIVGVPCLRLKGDYLAVATLGLGEIIRIVINNLEVVGGPRGFINIPKWTNLFWVYFWALVTIVVVTNLSSL